MEERVLRDLDQKWIQPTLAKDTIAIGKVYTEDAEFLPPNGPAVRGSTPIRNPPILLYEQDATTPSGLRLVGVSYLFVAPSDADGQPTNPPFPKALASWHKHNNVCVLPDNSASVELTEAQCLACRGRFTAETSWLLHAWIWKDSPAGVFSPMNPLVN